MSNKRSIMVLGAATSVVLLAACGNGGEAGSPEGADVSSLSVLDYYNDEPTNTHVQEHLEQCAADLGVDIERQSVPGEELIQTVLQRSSSDTLPDVLMLDNPDVQEIASTGALHPLENFNVDTSGFIDGFTDAATYEGSIYALGPAANTLALFYNVDVLAEAGVEPPQTWDELKDAAAELTEGNQYGVGFSAAATYEGTWQFLPFMWTNGGDEENLDSPENAEAVQLLVDLVDAGSASSSVVNWGQGDVNDQFIDGRTAMMVNGPWQIPALNERADFDFDVVQVPVNDPGQIPVAPLGGEMWTVPVTGNEANEQMAADFVECVSSEEYQLEYNETRFTIPTRPTLHEDYIEAMPDMAAFTEQVQNARARTALLGTEWPSAAQDIYTGVQLALTHQTSADDAFSQ